MIPTCATCRFFVPDFIEEIDEAIKDGDEVPEVESGTCHFHAPQPVLFQFLQDEEADTTTIWPAVEADDWCGSYKMVDRKGVKGK